MVNRRSFLKASALAATSLPLRGSAAAQSKEIHALLLHLGYNMWCDYLPDDMDNSILVSTPGKGVPDTVLRNKDELWRKATDHAAKSGMNMIVIDLGEGLIYPSHPELAIKGSWSAEKLQKEISRLETMGMEVIPKLNFSTTHNGWMKHYRRMVSSKPYYQFCEDLIRDVAEIFGKPRFFHVGCDEERADHQVGAKHFRFILERNRDLWEHDFSHLVRTCEKNGMRCWAWSDYSWNHPDFLKRCPKSVLMSNWFYDECYGGFDLAKNKTSDHKILNNFYDLDKAGFDQLPCGTNWAGYGRCKLKVGADDVIGKLVNFGRKEISAQHLKGFMMAPWRSLDGPENFATVMKAIDLFGAALKA